jgi:hypothetical protein
MRRGWVFFSVQGVPAGFLFFSQSFVLARQGLFLFICLCVHLFLFFFLFFWWDWGLSSGLCDCKAGVLLTEPHLQFLLWLFWRWDLWNYLLGLTLNNSAPF